MHTCSFSSAYRLIRLAFRTLDSMNLLRGGEGEEDVSLLFFATSLVPGLDLAHQVVCSDDSRMVKSPDAAPFFWR